MVPVFLRMEHESMATWDVRVDEDGDASVGGRHDALVVEHLNIRTHVLNLCVVSMKQPDMQSSMQ